MSDIFKDNRLYPDEDTPLLKHFSQYFSCIYVGLLPFFKMPGQKTHSFKSSNQISLDKFKEQNEGFQDFNPDIPIGIYTQSEDYPDDKDIYNHGIAYTWTEIIRESALKDFKEINNALKTSIGAYVSKFKRFDLAKLLDVYCDHTEVWYPYEGTFGVLTKRSIYRFLLAIGIEEVIVVAEFGANHKKLLLKEYDEQHFIDAIEMKDYYIYSSDKEILFSIDWDDFFFLIACDEDLCIKIEESQLFEGFIANESDTVYWALNNEL